MPRLVVYEMGTHYLDTFRYLFGEPDSIFARLHHDSPHVIGEDVQLLTLSYQGLTGLINHSWASLPVSGLDTPEGGSGIGYSRLEIDGTQGTLSLNGDGSMHLYTEGDHQQWQFSPDTGSKSFIAAQQHFIALGTELNLKRAM